MSLTFIAAVNTELKRRHQGLNTAVGWKERSLHTQPPCVRWIADAAVFDNAPMQRDDMLAQPLVGRVLKYNVECWGKTPDETQVLAKSVMRVCHRLGTGAAFTVESETWTGLEGSGAAILGELATLVIGIRDDVTDDAEATDAPPREQSAPTGGFTP